MAGADRCSMDLCFPFAGFISTGFGFEFGGFIASGINHSHSDSKESCFWMISSQGHCSSSRWLCCLVR